MVKECTCVYATSSNTESVRKGFEMGGYLKERCNHCKMKEGLGLLQEAIDRLKDMLQGDDGQAWKEAQKFVDKVAAATPAQDKQDTADKLPPSIEAYRKSNAFAQIALCNQPGALIGFQHACAAMVNGSTPLPTSSQDKQDAVDAAMLDWLETQASATIHHPVDMPNTISESKSYLIVDYAGDHLGSGATLRAAIRAAMQAQGGKK